MDKNCYSALGGPRATRVSAPQRGRNPFRASVVVWGGTARRDASAAGRRAFRSRGSTLVKRGLGRGRRALTALGVRSACRFLDGAGYPALRGSLARKPLSRRWGLPVAHGRRRRDSRTALSFARSPRPAPAPSERVPLSRRGQRGRRRRAVRPGGFRWIVAALGRTDSPGVSADIFAATKPNYVVRNGDTGPKMAVMRIVSSVGKGVCESCPPAGLPMESPLGFSLQDEEGPW